MVGILLSGLKPQHFCACLKPGPTFPSEYVVVFVFNDLCERMVVRSVHIGCIVDHHRFKNFLFITIKLIFAASWLSTQNKESTAKIGSL